MSGSMSVSLLSEPLNGSLEGNPDAAHLRQLLVEREEQLKDTIRVGERILEERDELNRQVEAIAVREAQAVAAHRREVNSLNQQLHEALNEREHMSTRGAELQTELREAQEQAAKYREELKRVATTNDALRADVRNHERDQEVTRRQSVMADTVEERNSTLRAEAAQLERELATAKATAASLHAQREADRTNWQQQVNGLREKANAMQLELDRARREAEVHRERLKDAERQAAQHVSPYSGDAAGQQSRKSFKGPAPSVPRLRLEDTERLDRDYEAFSARTKGRSSVVFTLGSGDYTQNGASPNDGSGPRRNRRRNSNSDDEGDSPSTSPAPINGDMEMTDRRGGKSGRQGSAGYTAVAVDERNGNQGTTKSGGKNGSYDDNCPTCGRSNLPPPPAEKKKSACPCIVM
jgi:hypothetical protein